MHFQLTFVSQRSCVHQFCSCVLSCTLHTADFAVAKFKYLLLLCVAVSMSNKSLHVFAAKHLSQSIHTL